MNKIVQIGILLFLFAGSLGAQVKVGLDHWYNRETNAKTGIFYHYLWTDTAWSGYSRWGDIFVKKGAEISMLENRPTVSSMSPLVIYIIVDPDTLSENKQPNYIESEEIKTIESWVKKGGILVLMANDGPNCEFTHLNQLADRFGMTFNHVSLHPVTDKKWEMGAFTALPAHPVFKGVSKIYLKEISSLTLKSPAKAILTEKGNVFMAENKVGKGMVIAVCDPWIYNEYMDHDRLPEDFQNRQAAINFTDYLLENANKRLTKSKK